MKIYILSEGSYTDWSILGIYSTLEKAEADKHIYENPRTKPDWWDDNEPYTRVANPIQEYEVDSRVAQEYLDPPWETP